MLFDKGGRAPTRSGPRAIPVLGSIAAHLLFFAWLFAPGHPAKKQSAYDQLIRPQETHLVWYNFKRKLPDVSPAKANADTRPLKAETVDKQVMISSPQDAPKAAQMIFHPAPEMKPVAPTPLPNLIALAAPPPPPVPIPKREFVLPKPSVPQTAPARAVELTPAPELRASVSAPKLPQLAPVKRPFVPPAERARLLTAKVEVTPAPELSPAKAELGASAAKAIQQGARTLAFRPQAPRSITTGLGAMPDAPVLDGKAQSTLNVAVVGLNPIDSLNVELPAGSRKAQFSAGPKLNPEGAVSTGKASGVSVPDLLVRGGEKGATPALIARVMSPSYNAPTSLEALRAGAREGSKHVGSGEDVGRPSGTQVSGAPDARFLGRQVFSVAIQSPNLTSHEGSWLMWYADRAALTYRAVLSAPSPLHKVDPKYIPTAAEERVEGTVRLAFVIGLDGHVSGVETVKGIDARLDRSATEALEKWQFEPALREGHPVEVDAVVEIPFRLPPKAPK